MASDLFIVSQLLRERTNTHPHSLDGKKITYFLNVVVTFRKAQDDPWTEPRNRRRFLRFDEDPLGNPNDHHRKSRSGAACHERGEEQKRTGSCRSPTAVRGTGLPSCRAVHRLAAVELSQRRGQQLCRARRIFRHSLIFEKVRTGGGFYVGRESTEGEKGEVSERLSRQRNPFSPRSRRAGHRLYFTGSGDAAQPQHQYESLLLRSFDAPPAAGRPWESDFLLDPSVDVTVLEKRWPGWAPAKA